MPTDSRDEAAARPDSRWVCGNCLLQANPATHTCLGRFAATNERAAVSSHDALAEKVRALAAEHTKAAGMYREIYTKQEDMLARKLESIHRSCADELLRALGEGGK